MLWNIAREKSSPSLDSFQARRDGGVPGERGFSLGQGEKNRQVCLITRSGE